MSVRSRGPEDAAAGTSGIGLKGNDLRKNILMREDDEAPEAWTLAELLCMSQGETFIGC